MCQPWSGHWWGLSLLKHDYNLLISLWPASPPKKWTGPSFLVLSQAPLSFHSPPADSLWIFITRYPSSSCLPPAGPFLSPQYPLCSVNVNHISISFIRRCTPLMLSERSIRQSDCRSVTTIMFRTMSSFLTGTQCFSITSFTSTVVMCCGWWTASARWTLRRSCHSGDCGWRTPQGRSHKVNLPPQTIQDYWLEGNVLAFGLM